MVESQNLYLFMSVCTLFMAEYMSAIWWRLRRQSEGHFWRLIQISMLKPWCFTDTLWLYKSISFQYTSYGSVEIVYYKKGTNLQMRLATRWVKSLIISCQAIISFFKLFSSKMKRKLTLSVLPPCTYLRWRSSVIEIIQRMSTGSWRSPCYWSRRNSPCRLKSVKKKAIKGQQSLWG